MYIRGEIRVRDLIPQKKMIKTLGHKILIMN
jgi:hypothetical protein